MKKRLNRFATAFIIFVIIELLLVVGFGFIYYFNAFNIKENEILVPIIYVGLCVLVVVNLLITWISFALLSRMRHKSDVASAELLGGDIQEAYKFGEIGLVMVDENDTIIWINELFVDRQFDIVDKNIYEWIPELEGCKTISSETPLKIKYSNRNYSVRYLSEAGLYIFRDDTDYEIIDDMARRQATVVGLIMIDNYSDVSGTADDSSDTISKVRNIIFEYVKNFKVQIRRYRNDAYFLICDYEALSNMIADKFSLLEKVHQIAKDDTIPPTLSLGIAHGTPDVVALNEMAENAIKVAMTRGGDQVVVSCFGKELEFFGGKFEAQEDRNKVKVRVMADSVLTLIKQASNVIIMGHKISDMDSMGSCLGMKAICEYLHKDAVVVYDTKSIERKTFGAMTSTFTREDIQKLTVSPADAEGLVRSNTLVIVCDVHKPSLTLSPNVLANASKVMVIDHHRRGEEFIDSPIFTYIEPSASSASELIAELIKYSSANPRIIIPANYATIMLSGLFMDSNFFKAKTVGIRTFEASMILKENGADNSKADDFLKDEFEEYTLITKIISTLKTAYVGVVYCVADDEDIIEQATLAKVGNRCMQMRGINAVFVIGRTSAKDVAVSCRSDGTINVQLLAEQLNGGGHMTQAAGVFKNSDVETVEQRLLDVLSEYLNEARSVKKEDDK